VFYLVDWSKDKVVLIAEH